MTGGDDRVRRDLLAMMEAGIAAAHPDRVVPPGVERLFASPPAGDGHTLVLGAGKAAAHMARAFERAYPWPCHGLVVTRHGYAVGTERIGVVEAGHPTPDEAGVAAARRLHAMASGARPHDRVVFLLSGGASSLLPRPIPGVTLGMKGAVTEALLASGMAIAQVNRVRSALSLLKGGGLARACPAPITTLAISDVVGDDPAAIGSGPTRPGLSDQAEVLDVLDGIAPAAAAALRSHRGGGLRGEPAVQGRYEIVARADDMLSAALGTALALGYEAWVEDGSAEGEARTVAARHAASFRHREPSGRPRAMLTGGELTVTLGKADLGRDGGPNQEYVLAAALALRGGPPAHVLAIDSDGIDGRGLAAGALLGTADMERTGCKPDEHAAALSIHDTGRHLAALDALVTIGPTGTNVNDLRVMADS